MQSRVFLLCFALALLLPNALGESSNIDLNVSQTGYYIKDPQNISVRFNFINLRDDDSSIDRVDFYILDLSANNIDFVAFSGSGWQREFLARFGDDHFWITNASSQSLEVTIKPKMSAEGSYDLKGYYQFFDQTGSVIGFGDNRPLFPLVDVVDHVFARIIVDKTAPSVSFIGEPEWTSQGLMIQASVNDLNPIASVKLSYNGKTGQKTVDANYSPSLKQATALIPLSEIVEGSQINYSITATDAAGNNGSAQASFTARDNPQITDIRPSTVLPQVPITLYATITDSSGIKSASVKINNSETAIPMAKGSGDVWSASIGSFAKGATVEYSITASDNLDNVSTETGSFEILQEFTIHLTVLDAVFKTPVNNVTLVVSSRTVSSGGANFVIPEKTINFSKETEFQQLQGRYYFSFSAPQYNTQVYSYDVQSDVNKTILMGTGEQSEILDATITPKVSDDNKSYYLNVSAIIKESFPVKYLKLVYSINSDDFGSELSLSQKQGSEYYAVLGPFTGEMVLYSRLELSDATDQVFIYDLGVRWFSLISALGGIGVGVELCGNSKDDNNNGLIDEGCPCKEADTQSCSKNVGICKLGIQKCLNGKWSETCEGGILPVPEICGNKLDDDCDNLADNGCFIDSDDDGLSDEQEEKIKTNPRNPDTDGDNVSDGQEFLKDNTNPLDSKSNLLYVDLKAQVNFGDNQEIRLLHPTLGIIKGISASILAPSGRQESLAANEDGTISFKPEEQGIFSIKVSKNKFESVKEFTVGTGFFSIGAAAGPAVSYIFGENIVKAPLAFIFVLALCFILGWLANSQLRILLKQKKVVSSSEERKELIKRSALVLVIAVIPLAVFKLSSVENSVLSAFGLIIVLVALGYAAGFSKTKKAVRVEEEEKKPASIAGSLISKVKGFFITDKKTADIKLTKEWKKLDWEFGEKGEEAREAGKPETLIGEEKPESGKGFEYQTPETQTSESTSSYSPSEAVRSVEVWKRFEPVEFEDRMTEIGKEVEKTLEKKLLEVGDEIEKKVGKKLAEVEEEIDRRVSRRLLETEEEVERRVGRKVQEVEEDVDRKMKKRMLELEEEIGQQVERKLASERVKRKENKFGLARLKKHALLKQLAFEELKKAALLQKVQAPQIPKAGMPQAGFVLKETKEPASLAVQKPEQLQSFSKSEEQNIQELTRQLAVLNSSYAQGLVQKEEFETKVRKLREELAKLQK